jgi:flagellar protein FlgJ
MTATLVPTTKTSYTTPQMIEGFIRGWFNEFGELPKKQSVGVIWSQNAIETGSTTAMWNNNIGNVKYSPSKNPNDDNNIKYMMLNNVWEIINGKKIIFQPPDPATWFRSFDSLEEGVGFHLNFLKNKRYKNSWAAVEAGDPEQFAHLLKIAKYYTASEADYAKGMRYHFNKFIKDQTFESVIDAIQKELNADKPENPSNVLDAFDTTFSNNNS